MMLNAYLHHGDIPSGRVAVDNCKTDTAKAAYVWMMMADIWNDKKFASATDAQPEWHPHLQLLK